MPHLVFEMDLVRISSQKTKLKVQKKYRNTGKKVLKQKHKDESAKN